MSNTDYYTTPTYIVCILFVIVFGLFITVWCHMCIKKRKRNRNRRLKERPKADIVERSILQFFNCCCHIHDRSHDQLSFELQCNALLDTVDDDSFSPILSEDPGGVARIHFSIGSFKYEINVSSNTLPITFGSAFLGNRVDTFADFSDFCDRRVSLTYAGFCLGRLLLTRPFRTFRFPMSNVI
uniref:Uncharacterized protein n=1 Tax=Glossina pallidipes TaxID=7398 RepID=A0A1A9ZE13_GLOPL